MIRRPIALAVTVVTTPSACASRHGDVLKGYNFTLAPVYAAPHGQMFSMTAAVLR